MEKRIMSILLVLSMVLTLLPMTALAENVTWTIIGNSSFNADGSIALSENGKSYKLVENVDCSLIRSQ